MTAKLHRVHMPKVGEYLASIGSGVPFEIDTVQKYSLGHIMRLGSKTFVYGLAGGTLNTDMGAKNALTQHIAYTTIAASAAAGVSSIVLDTIVTDGVAGDGVIAANELVGGQIVFFPHSSNTFIRGIVANTATTNTGGGVREMTVALDSPTPVAIVVDVTHCEAMASPYLNVQTLTTATMSVVGIPTVPATVGKFLWLQTAGPIWVAPQNDVSTGNNNRLAVFRHDGSVDAFTYNDANVGQAQIAGWVLANASGAGQGAPFIWLTIGPF
jgi:hypothetical protein